MAIFAVMHLFAFPWKVYSLKHTNPVDISGSGFSGEPKYKGGPFGIKAMANAFNPWDIIKASARGFRWLFVGYRRRTDDPSYQPNKLGGTTGYAGPTYAGNGDNATELRPSYDSRLGRERTDTVGTDVHEDDRAGLLRNSANPARGPSVSPHYQPYMNDEYAAGDDSQLDLGAPHRLQAVSSSDSEAPNPGMFTKASDYGPGRPSGFEEDTGYHAGGGPSGTHPALRDEGIEGQQWDHWAGAERPGDASSLRPPTYRTNDPHG